MQPYHHSRTRASICEATEVQEGGNASPKYHIRKQAGEYNRDVDDSSQGSEGEGENMSEPLCTELVETESTPNDSFEVENVTNASEKAESTPTYNLRSRPDMNYYASNRIFVLFFNFLGGRM